MGAGARLPVPLAHTYSWVSVAASASLVAGTVLYTSKFQSWSFRKIIFSTQLLLVLANLLDALWVSRLSRKLGVTDGLMAFGEEIFIDVVDAMNSQPFFIYAAKLCPHSVEASMFALFMGLSNFGGAAGRYMGSSLLKLLGGVQKPDYENLTTFVILRSLARLLPCLLVPLLVPQGSPADTAKAMGAGLGVTGGSTFASSSSDSPSDSEYLPSELHEPSTASHTTSGLVSACDISSSEMLAAGVQLDDGQRGPPKNLA